MTEPTAEVTLSARVDQNFAARLDGWAKRTGRDRAKAIRVLLAAALDAEEAKVT